MTSSAELLAADLAGARVDPNEAQKALTYLHTNLIAYSKSSSHII